MENSNATRNYKATIAFSSKELTKVEKIALKDTSDASKLLDVCESIPAEFFVLDVAYYVELDIHNDSAKGDKDYKCYLFVDKEGHKYTTSSQSFWNSFIDIAEEMEGEEFKVKVFTKPSKNYSGKPFLTCSIYME